MTSPVDMLESIARTPKRVADLSATPPLNNKRLRVLLIPDSTHWVTGTIAKSIARFNPWIEATIVSGPVMDAIFSEQREFIHNFDLVHFVCPYASRKWLPRFRDFVPCVTSHHHVTDWTLLKHNLQGDAIVAGSAEWAEDLRIRGADMSRVFVVPYGVDADIFRPPSEAERKLARACLRISDGAAVVGFFGKNSSNDDDRKGINVLNEALRSLNKQIDQLAALIVGPGWGDLVGSLKSSGVHCVWLPFITDQRQLAKMYHALDFYWVTARVEGGPVTLLEAMSSGVCCLTTPVGIAREIVNDGEDGLLLPFNAAEIFVERTLSLIRDASERMRLGCNARETILREMHAGITTQRVRAVYAKALSVAQERLSQQPFDMSTFETGSFEFENPGAGANRIPLHGLPDDIHARVRMLEDLAWSEHLILYHQQRAAALKLIVRAWMKNPLSLMPPRVILRRFMPGRIVQAVVRLKNGTQPKLKALPG